MINVFLLVSAAMVTVGLFNIGSRIGDPSAQPSSKQFLAEVKRGKVSEVEIDGQEIRGRRSNGELFRTISPSDPGLVGDLIDNGVETKTIPPEKPGLSGQLFFSLLPLLLVIGAAAFFMRRMQGGAGGSGVFGFGKSRARKFGENEVKVKLADRAGVDEAREEVGELVEFRKDPQRFGRLGGNTASTLLPKAYTIQNAAWLPVNQKRPNRRRDRRARVSLAVDR